MKWCRKTEVKVVVIGLFLVECLTYMYVYVLETVLIIADSTCVLEREKKKAREKKDEKSEFAFCFSDCQHLKDRTRMKRRRRRSEETCVRKHTLFWSSGEVCVCTSLSMFVISVRLRKMWLMRCENHSTTLPTANNSCTHVQNSYRHLKKQFPSHMDQQSNGFLFSLLTIECPGSQCENFGTTDQYSS